MSPLLTMPVRCSSTSHAYVRTSTLVQNGRITMPRISVASLGRTDAAR